MHIYHSKNKNKITKLLTMAYRFLWISTPGTALSTPLTPSPTALSPQKSAGGHSVTWSFHTLPLGMVFPLLTCPSPTPSSHHLSSSHSP